MGWPRWEGDLRVARKHQSVGGSKGRRGMRGSRPEWALAWQGPGSWWAVSKRAIDLNQGRMPNPGQWSMGSVVGSTAGNQTGSLLQTTSLVIIQTNAQVPFALCSHQEAQSSPKLSSLGGRLLCTFCAGFLHICSAARPMQSAFLSSGILQHVNIIHLYGFILISFPKLSILSR